MSITGSLYRCATRARRVIAPRRTDSLTAESVAKAILDEERFVALDVGAANGLLPHWELLNGAANVYQIDPREDACSELERMNDAVGLTNTRHVVRAGVAASDGARTLFVSNAPTGTSILKFDPSAEADCGDYVDPHYLFPIVERHIETKRLETIMADAGEDRVDMIKLDIQGAELEALQGLGSNRLSNILGIELEVGMHSFYPREARFPAVEGFMDENGLELFDVRVARVRRPLDGDHGGYETNVFAVDPNSPTIAARIWELDAVYFRKKSLLLAKGDAGEIRRMALVYATYNYYSEAHSLVEKSLKEGIFDLEAATALQQAIVDLHYISNYRPWLSNTVFWRAVRSLGGRFSPRNSPRWCQHMYQAYPNG